MKCSVPYCPSEAVKTVKLKHANGEPEVRMCDVHAEKFRFIEDELDSLSKTRGFNETYSLFSVGIEFLKQALLAFGVGLNETSAIMARAALETALFDKFIAKDLKFDNNGMLVSYAYSNEYFDMLKNKKIGLQYLINYAKDSGLLNNELLECANKVKNNGDHVAHLTGKFTRELAKAIEYSMNDYLSQIDNLKIWLGDNEAKDNIVCAVKIIQHLIEETYKLRFGSH